MAALAATLVADWLGRRRFLLFLTSAGCLGSLGFALAREPLWLAIAAFFGMLNGMGRDRGAALILEQAVLPATAEASDRTRVIAGYTMLQDIGHAVGSLLAGLPAYLIGRSTSSVVGDVPERWILFGAAGTGAVALVAYAVVGATIENARGGTRLPKVSPESRRLLTRLSALFALDALGGGFLTSALLSYFFFTRFHASEVAISALFFGARVMNAGLASGGGLARAPHRSRQHHGLHAHPVERPAHDGRDRAELPGRCRAVPAPRRPGRDGRPHATVLRPAGGAPEERTVATGVTNLVRWRAWPSPARRGSADGG